MDEPFPPSLGNDERRSIRPWVLAMALVLVAWNGFQCWRLSFPMRVGHEGFIGRQIGRAALNHLVLGVQTTKLANVTAIKQDGSLILHRSYGPMASWTVAAGMVVGLPYDLAIRLPVLVSMNLFLIGIALLAWRLGGPPASLTAFLVAALAPIVLFRYALLCVFENLGIGPFMLAIGLGFEPTSRYRTIAVGFLSTLAVLFSWIFLTVLGPWLLYRTIRDRRIDTALLAFATVFVPLVVYLGTLQAVTGDCLADVRSFFIHLSERSSSSTLRGKDDTVLTPAFMAKLNGERLTRNIGWLPLAGSLLSLGLLLRGRRFGPFAWCSALLVMALLLNFMPNLAYLHDFFVLLYVPAMALSCGLLIAGTSRGYPPRRVRLALFCFLTVFVALDVLPRSKFLRTHPESERHDVIARELGRRVRPNDLVITDPSVCTFEPDLFTATDENRECAPLPFYGGRFCQTVLVAGSAEEAGRLILEADLTRERKVYVLNCGAIAWTLPEHFQQCTFDSPVPSFQLWEIDSRSLTALRQSVESSRIRR